MFNDVLCAITNNNLGFETCEEVKAIKSFSGSACGGKISFVTKLYDQLYLERPRTKSILDVYCEFDGSKGAGVDYFIVNRFDWEFSSMIGSQGMDDFIRSLIGYGAHYPAIDQDGGQAIVNMHRIYYQGKTRMITSLSLTGPLFEKRLPIVIMTKIKHDRMHSPTVSRIISAGVAERGAFWIDYINQNHLMGLNFDILQRRLPLRKPEKVDDYEWPISLALLAVNITVTGNVLSGIINHIDKHGHPILAGARTIEHTFINLDHVYGVVKHRGKSA